MGNKDRAIIITEGLTRRFDDVVAVDSLDLEVRAGEVFGFLGHNGAGKTTTVRLLNGILAPSAGQVRVLGLEPVTEGPALRRRTGVLTETPSLDERLTGWENLSIFADLYDVPQGEVAGRVEQLLEMFDLQDRAGEKVGNYSRGMKQRLALARALVHRPEILFLDEPTAGLDPVVTRRVHELIVHLSREEARTVFLCTHNLAEAQKLCSRVAVLEHGKLVALGTPAELARTAGRGQNLKVEVAPEGLAAARVVLASARLREADQAPEEPGTLLLPGVERESIPGLVAALVEAGVRLYRVASQEPSLEDIYFALQSSLPGNQEAES